MYVLGIDTSCDDTAIALVEGGEIIHSNVIASQQDLLQKYGGVYPEMACRRHIELCKSVLEQALQGFSMEEVALIAATRGPGLIGALLIGLNFAKSLSLSYKKPFIAINHLEAHLHAAMIGKSIPFPALGVVISGGHTALLKIDPEGFSLIGETLDDAIGEAFDKVARLLGLSPPSGGALEALAQRGDPYRYPFKGGESKERPFDLSFSGLKTAVLYATQKEALMPADIAASFQQAAFTLLLKKMEKAIDAFHLQSIVLGGGVCKSNTLRSLCNAKFSLPLFFPPPDLCLDNAAMIAALAFHEYRKRGPDPLTINAQARIPFVNKIVKN